MSGTEIKPADLKKPMSFLKKFGLGALSGVGGMSQGVLDNALIKFIPNNELSKFLQWLAYSLANGLVTNEYLSNFLIGGSASSAKELVVALYQKWFAEKSVGKSTTSPNTSMALPMSNDDSLI